MKNCISSISINLFFKKIEHKVNIAGTKFLRFLFAIKKYKAFAVRFCQLVTVCFCNV